MTNFEKIKTLTKNELSKLNVKGYCYMCGYRTQMDFITTDGRLFDTREEAEDYELKWLDKKEDDSVL